MPMLLNQLPEVARDLIFEIPDEETGSQDQM